MNINAGLSYSERDGISANVGLNYGLGKDPKTGLNLGVSYNRQDGMGASVGLTSKGGVLRDTGANITRSEYSGFGADISSREYGPGKFSGGLSYNQRDGFTASLNVAGTNALNYNSQTGLSSNTDFISQYSMNRGMSEDSNQTDTEAESRAAQERNNQTQGAQAIEGFGFAGTRREDGLNGSHGVIGFGDDGPTPAHGAPSSHDPEQTLALSGSFEGESTGGRRPLSAEDKAAFWDNWKGETRAQTDASIAELRRMGYDTAEIEGKVSAYRNNQDSKPATTSTPPTTHQSQGTGLYGGVVQNILNSVVTGASSLWDRVTGGLVNSNQHYANTPGEGLPHQFNANGEGFYNVAGQGTYMDHKYGQKPLVDTLSNAINDWHKNNPNHPIPVNDLGYKSGKSDPNVNNDPRIVPHHGGGNQVDLGYIVSGGGKYGGDYNNNPHYDRDKTIELIKTISRNIPEGVGSYDTNFVKFNDPAVLDYFDKNKLPNLQMTSDNLLKPNAKVKHSNHLHLQLDLPKPKVQ
ncbi:hypothetical protein LEP1GSC188_0098 [Leptospira weilii serovar Topaz str. LT2116]|uniref:Large structural domain protein n=1 Tax=Leptospira weilii serovar Topaz str. LT2116 TaxID=1088540 RepID=M3G0V6_9LEPT|nr:hypothetical protein LEP1GSC188_0098 [Leptospira weilii serovar Topaz str. LT2116]